VAGRRAGQEAIAVGSPGVALFRPESAQLAVDRPDQTVNTWPARVDRRVFMGSYIEYIVSMDAADGAPTRLTVRTGNHSVVTEGDSAWVHVDPADVSVLAP
jgi:hypothetical protein